MARGAAHLVRGYPTHDARASKYKAAVGSPFFRGNHSLFLHLLPETELPFLCGSACRAVHRRHTLHR